VVQSKVWVIVLIACQIGFSEEAQKPVCNAETVGQFWPAEANRDRASLARLAHCGVLEVCSHGVWRYHWDRMTIRIDQLRKKPARPSGNSSAAGCAVLPDAPPIDLSLP
jgi:hypothetical protein